MKFIILKKMRFAFFRFTLLLVLSTSFANAGAGNCPYNLKDADSGGLIASLTRTLKADLTDLESQKQKHLECSGIPIRTPAGLSTSLISQISAGMVKREQSFSSILLSGKKMSCTSDPREFSTIILSYIDHCETRFGHYRDTISMGDLEFTGEDGQLINRAYLACYNARRTAIRGGATEAQAQTAYVECINTALYGGINIDPNNPDSLVRKTWTKNCVQSTNFADSKEIQDLLNKQIASDLKFNTTQEALKFAFNEVADTLNQLTDPSNQAAFEKCNMGSQVLRVSNGLVTTALSAAAVMGTPWTGLVASLLTNPITNLIGNIGSGAKKIQDIKESLKQLSFKDEERFGNYACQLLSAQDLACSTQAAANERPNVCVNCGQAPGNDPTKNIQFIKATLDDLNSQGMMEKYYADWFTTKQPVVSAGGAPNTASLYAFIFGDSDFSVLKYLRKNKGNSFETGALIEDLNALKAELDPFKTKYDSFIQNGGNKADVEHAKDKIDDRISGDHKKLDMNKVFARYYQYLTVDTDPALPDPVKDLYKVSMVNFVNLSASAQIESAKAELADGTKHSRYENLNRLFKTFNDQDGKGYIREQINDKMVAANLEKTKALKERLKTTANRINEQFYIENFYPVVRDCLMAFQLNVEQKKEGVQLGTEYKKMCQMFSACTGANNTIGLPFDVQSKNLDFGFEAGKNFKMVCQTNQNYDLITRLAKEELTSKGSLCGKSVTAKDFLY